MTMTPSRVCEVERTFHENFSGYAIDATKRGQSKLKTVKKRKYGDEKDMLIMLEKELKDAMPTAMSDALQFVSSNGGQDVHVRYSDEKALCALKGTGDVTCAHITIEFTFADPSWSILNGLGRSALVKATHQIEPVIESFRQLGFVLTKEDTFSDGSLLMACQMETCCDSVHDTSLLLSQIHELGLEHALELPENLMVSRASRAFNGKYTVQPHRTLTDFRVLDGRGIDVAEYDSKDKTVRFGWILAEWEVEHEEEIDHVQQDLETYIDQYLTRFDSQLTYEVEHVLDISDDKTTAALEVICSAPCASVDDIASVMTESRQIIEELSTLDWFA